ncbi:hypothetical protein J1N35_044868 [Gossypium stocksii]|uniref:Uncharacterized protein n=1 Tax=Gossypium stocksii TaxID=47602 RepID=A0A9D3UA21_9ROSI|nr:hypothetical protein J1N35_044868 [Gossypium stocksii]
MTLSKSELRGIYVEFARTNEGSRRLTYFLVREVIREEQTKSVTTQLCGRFTALLESSHYDTPESPMGRHSSLSTTARTPNNQGLVDLEYWPQLNDKEAFGTTHTIGVMTSIVDE